MKPSLVRRMAFPAVCLLAVTVVTGTAGLLVRCPAAGFAGRLLHRPGRPRPRNRRCRLRPGKGRDLCRTGGPGRTGGAGVPPLGFCRRDRVGCSPWPGRRWLWGSLCWAGPFFPFRRAAHRQRQQMIRLLEAARTGQPLPLLTGDGMAEGNCGPLADEIQKTITELALTRQAAVTARDRFAQNLANIAAPIENAPHRPVPGGPECRGGVHGRPAGAAHRAGGVPCCCWPPAGHRCPAFAPQALRPLQPC